MKKRAVWPHGWVQGYADGEGTNAQFWYPSGVAVDAETNVYVSDTGPYDDPGTSPGYSVRVIRPSGSNWNVSTVAITQSAGLELTFGAPMTGVAVDSLGNVYASVSYNLIAEIPSMGAQSEVGGSIDAYGLAAYKTGVLYAASGNGIYRFSQNGSGAWVQSLFAGGTKGSANGTGADAQFSAPQGVAVDASGKVYVSDTGNNLIRTILPSGDVGLLAGAGNASAGSSDGSGTDARFNRPTGIASDASGNLYVADAGNNTIRTVTPAGLVNTLAGLAGSEGTNDGVGSDARFNDPEGLAVDPEDNVYVADTGNAAVRMITPDGVVSTIATGLSHPCSVALDSYGNVYSRGASLFLWAGGTQQYNLRTYRKFVADQYHCNLESGFIDEQSI